MRFFTRCLARYFPATLLAIALAGCNNSSGTATVTPGTQLPVQTLQSAIQNVVVIYQENWSFDGLYGNFPGANGLSRVSMPVTQIDKFTGAKITSLPQPVNNGAPDPNLQSINGMPVQPYNLANYIQPSQLTGDIVHRFYQEQGQIDGGKMDQFMSWSDNPGLLMSFFDASNLPEGQLAQQYTMMDNFFHSAYGGSFLNHQFLICACAPAFPNAPASVIAKPDATGARLALDSTGKVIQDGFVTPDGFAVNTSFTVNTPHPSTVAANQLVPNQTAPTIGDRLTAGGVSWKWYSGGWNNALAGNPDPLFQFHHQAFAYYANYKDGTQAKADHLQDETNFFSDVQNNSLPAVSFIKPLGPDNEHPGYAALLRGQQHVQQIVQAVQQSKYWGHTAIIVTYDENGGRWDHVAPPAIDRWGAGTRVPAILISPWAKRGFVDHTQYETVSILALIEKIWNLAPLGTRDAAANPMLNAFDFTQRPMSTARNLR